jgi:hypothetical protein
MLEFCTESEIQCWNLHVLLLRNRAFMEILTVKAVSYLRVQMNVYHTATFLHRLTRKFGTVRLQVMPLYRYQFHDIRTANAIF